MDLGLKDKIAFVAASSDGLGKAVAFELAKEGTQVIICGRDKDKLMQTKVAIEAVSAAKAKVMSYVCDLSDPAAITDMIQSVKKKVDKIDILVTNTGGPPTGKFEELSSDDWDKAYQQILVSATTLIRGFLPLMKAQNYGRIITITSQAVKQPVENLILSNSIRASVVGLMKTLSAELGQYNITVNNVMPGFTKTSRLNNLLKENPAMAQVTSDIPLGRFAEPEEFAAAVTFLASERASYITGISLAVDGGWIKNIL
jgi:3-oxoacyl-[acyl-carrier protein] reductase